MYKLETKGILYIIGSPIGNLKDITIRALETLKKVDLIYCEDTRQTKKILNTYEIKKPTKSLHSNSSSQKIETIIKLLKQDKSIAYLTDAGTPGISDPGHKLVNLVRLNNIKVIPIPGPSALTSLVSVSGFIAKDIFFAGFLSKKEGKKKKELESLKEKKGIIVIYESPYRIKKLLNLIADIFPENEIIIGREMTKIFEEYLNGKTSDLVKKINQIKIKGEFSVAILNQ